jgi:hypothetical protein
MIEKSELFLYPFLSVMEPTVYVNVLLQVLFPLLKINKMFKIIKIVKGSNQSISEFTIFFTKH